MFYAIKKFIGEAFTDAKEVYSTVYRIQKAIYGREVTLLSYALTFGLLYILPSWIRNTFIITHVLTIVVIVMLRRKDSRFKAQYREARVIND